MAFILSVHALPCGPTNLHDPAGKYSTFVVVETSTVCGARGPDRFKTESIVPCFQPVGCKLQVPGRVFNVKHHVHLCSTVREGSKCHWEDHFMPAYIRLDVCKNVGIARSSGKIGLVCSPPTHGRAVTNAFWELERHTHNLKNNERGKKIKGL